MNRILLTNFSLITVGLVVIAVFITAKTYTQLGIAVILYPIFAFFVYKVLQHTIWTFPANEPIAQVHPTVKVAEKVDDVKEESAGVTDINKRLFLKLIGVTGLAFFLISIFGRRIETLLLGQNLTTQLAPAAKTAAATSPTDGYTISEIDEGSIMGYYGFINQDGGWFIMKRDTENGSFRYAKGATDFSKNWKNRENLKYDYFHNAFVY